MTLSIFTKSFAFWFIFGFLIHFVTYFYAHDSLSREYVLSDGIFLTFAYFLGFIFLILLLLPLLNLRWKAFYLPESFKVPVIFFGITLSILYFFLSLDFYVNYGLGFRQSSEYSSSNTALLLLSIKQVMIVVIFSMIAHFLSTGTINKSSRLIFFICSISSFLSLDSSLGVLLVLISGFFVLVPSNSFNVIVRKEINLKNLFFYFLIFISLAFVIVYVGLIQKNINILEIATSEQSLFNLLFELLSVRLSTSFVALHNFVNTNLFNIELNFRFVQETFTLFQLRFEKLFPTGFFFVDPNWVGGINRINYEINYTINELNYLYRAGASPSLFASFLYFPFFPLNLFLMAGYIVFVSITYNSYFPVSKFNIFVPLGGIYFLYLFFESPMLLFAIDAYPILFILFILLSMVKFKPSNSGKSL